MTDGDKSFLDWAGRGKSIRDLVKELGSFEDQELIVELSFDGGVTSMPISLVVKKTESVY